MIFFSGQLIAKFKYKIPSSAEDFQQEIEYSLPFSGEWLVYNGGISADNSHSWEIYNQRFAYDMVIADKDNVRHQNDGKNLDDYYCYGEDIFSPADGEIVQIRNNIRDHKYPGTFLIDFLVRDFRGNFVVIKHAEKEYSFMAHFIPGSICVKKGERVKRGQVVGKCGNSGHSTEPHLHFHIQNHPNFYIGVGLPIKFINLSIDGQENKKSYIKKGQKVKSINRD